LVKILSKKSYIRQKAFTLLEILVSLSIAAFVIAGTSGLINTALQAEQKTRTQNKALQQARFAMQRMTHAVSRAQRLQIPLGENTATAWSESVRNVLAVSLDPGLDRDKDGWADANNDKDFLDVNNNGTRDFGEPEQIDEDFDQDNNYDGAAGIKGIDDNGDGTKDVEVLTDNDEDSRSLEDSSNGIDDDGDGSIDEDIRKDMNNDGKPGAGGVDDDDDGSIDEGQDDDDDEDGSLRDDWQDQQVVFLNGSTLMERLPNIDPVDGADYSEYPIAENVSQFRVERLTGGNASSVLIDISLTITPVNGVPVSLNTRVVVGSAL
jgi:prepilin-type N-terminal cleavage/methylation domain-containing protein